jgi:hypothetical protein
MASRKPALRAVKPDEAAVVTPWGTLGFDSERDMLLDDLRTLSERIKSPTTTATAVAALSKRKQEVFEQIKQLDSADDPDSILDDSEDEAWDVSG